MHVRLKTKVLVNCQCPILWNDLKWENGKRIKILQFFFSSEEKIGNLDIEAKVLNIAIKATTPFNNFLMKLTSINNYNNSNWEKISIK